MVEKVGKGTTTEISCKMHIELVRKLHSARYGNSNLQPKQPDPKSSCTTLIILDEGISHVQIKFLLFKDKKPNLQPYSAIFSY